MYTLAYDGKHVDMFADRYMSTFVDESVYEIYLHMVSIKFV